MKKQPRLFLENIHAQSNCVEFLIKKAIVKIVGIKADAFAGNHAAIRACLIVNTACT
jgi:predicted aspartyl protease